MIHEIPEEIIENSKRCRYKHGCLSSCAIFPQCLSMGEKKGNGIVVKKKPYCLGECLYHMKTTDPKINKSSLCFCPVFAEINKPKNNG
jgi:hypothetical protein